MSCAKQLHSLRVRRACASSFLPRPSGCSRATEVVYFSFSVQPDLAHLFSPGGRLSPRLADIEEECRCSVVLKTPQRQSAKRSGGGVAVEVFMDEGGDYARSVGRLSDLVLRSGGQWRILRLIRKLLMANGTAKYRVEQQQQLLLVPQVWAAADSCTRGGLVMSFANEEDGHYWSLLSRVSPFIELREPSAKDLWLHAVQLLASCTRDLAAEAAAGELVTFAAYTKSSQDWLCPTAELGSRGDSATEDSMITFDRNCSHEPQPGFIVLMSALLCAPPPQDDHDNVVSTASNSAVIRYTQEHACDCSTPNFAEPLTVTPGNAKSCTRQQQPAAVTRCARGEAPVCLTACEAAVPGSAVRAIDESRRLTVTACSCQPHCAPLETGELYQPLSYPGQLSDACQRQEMSGEAAGSASHRGRLQRSDAHPADALNVSTGALSGRVRDGAAAASVGTLRAAERSAGQPLNSQSCQCAAAAKGGRSTRKAALALSADGAPAPPLTVAHEEPPRCDNWDEAAATQVTAGLQQLLTSRLTTIQTTMAPLPTVDMPKVLVSGSAVSANAPVGRRPASARETSLLPAASTAAPVAALSTRAKVPASLLRQPSELLVGSHASADHAVTCGRLSVSAIAAPDGLCQPAAESSVVADGLARSDCRQASAALTPLTSAGTAGLERLLPATLAAVRGLSCSYQRLPDVAERSVVYALTFSLLTEPSECAAAAGAAQHLWAGGSLSSRSPVFPRADRQLAVEGVQEVRSAQLAAAPEAAEVTTCDSGLSLALIELHSGGATDCVALSLDDLKASERRQTGELTETTLTLGMARCAAGCAELVSGPVSCLHRLEAACHVRVFEAAGADRGLPAFDDSWHQLVGIVAGAASALNWAMAWPTAALETWAASAATTAASVSVSRHREPGVARAVSDDVTLCSELVWEARSRSNVTHLVLLT